MGRECRTLDTNKGKRKLSEIHFYEEEPNYHSLFALSIRLFQPISDDI